MPTPERQMREGVLIRTANLTREPRINAAQRTAIHQVSAADEEARLLGLDINHRPVVRARVGIPLRVSTWAILRNGDPTDAAKLSEVFREDTRVIREATP